MPKRERGERGGGRGKAQKAAKEREAVQQAIEEREQGAKGSDDEESDHKRQKLKEELTEDQPGESASAPGKAEATSSTSRDRTSESACAPGEGKSSSSTSAPEPENPPGWIPSGSLRLVDGYLELVTPSSASKAKKADPVVKLEETTLLVWQNWYQNISSFVLKPRRKQFLLPGLIRAKHLKFNLRQHRKQADLALTFGQGLLQHGVRSCDGLQQKTK